MTENRSPDGYKDVLSSVRRLVSSAIEEQAEEAAEKLILTPAQRVQEAPASEEKAPTTSPERTFPTLEERIAELEAAVGSEAADFEPDGSEDQAQHVPDGVVLPLNAAFVREAPLPEPSPEDQKDILFAVPGDPVGSDNAVPDMVDGPMSGVETDDEADGALADAMTAEAERSEGVDDPVLAEAQEESPLAPLDDPFPVDLSDPASGDLAVAANDDPSEEQSQEPPSPTVRLDPAIAPFRHRDGMAEGEPQKERASGEEPALLDEIGLRDLVAEIVREELQGGLGERITRNVRKLVRAEIQRAFAARDLG
ncbi:MAG: hypothetical protein AAF871_10245 [Pseudomonadota bacterium]